MFPLVMFWFLPLPPPQYSSGFLALQHLARLLSLFVLSTSSRPVSVYSADLLQCLDPIVRPPSSVCRKATNPPAIGRPLSSSGFLTQDHRRGRHILCPSTHTQAKYHQPHRLGGGVQTCKWNAESGNQKRTLVGR